MSERRDSSPSITYALLMAKLHSYCGSDSLSEDGLREIIRGCLREIINHRAQNCAPFNEDIKNYSSFLKFLKACCKKRVTEGLVRYIFFSKACYNERVTEGIIRCLLEYFPDAASSATTPDGETPLHLVCINKNVTLEIVRLLIDAFPSSVHQKDFTGYMPLHRLCTNENLNDAATLEILKFLVEKCPEVVLEAYPVSNRMDENRNRGALPFHCACLFGTVATAEYLYKLYPEAIYTAAGNGWYPIHYAFAGIEKRNDTSTVIGIVRFLLDCDGSSLRQVTKSGLMPLHYVCGVKNLDDAFSLEILTLFVEKCPESVRDAGSNGNLPIHVACGRGGKSPEFCRILIEAYPGSERMADNKGALPFHHACILGTVATAEYLYKLYPQANNMAADKYGLYPIHYAILGIKKRNDPATTIEMVRFLLGCDPNVALQEVRGRFPLVMVCNTASNTTSKLNARLEVIRLLYDAHPEAIENNDVSTNLRRFPQEIQTFINTQLAYARQARDHRLMTTPDENGQLPLHRALRDNVTLGSIKLLVNGNPSAVKTTDDSGAFPLLIACQHHDSASVIQYLLGLHATTIRAVDLDNKTALHYACRGAKHCTIALLLEKYDAASVSKRNAQNKLPINMLLESDQVRDREDIEYMDSIYRLIRAYPETLMDWSVVVTKQATFEDFPSHIVKKRKFGVD